MNLIDTHCHIHDTKYDFAPDVVENAQKAGVTRMITVGTDVADSRAAVELARAREGVFATVGIHPGTISIRSDLIEMVAELEGVIRSDLISKKGATGADIRSDLVIVGLGDIGLDYHYPGFDREKQIELFEKQLELAVKYDLPVAFHVRDLPARERTQAGAFDDFWAVLDKFPGVCGALHCFTDSVENLQRGLARGLYVSVNGLVTFNQNPELAEVYKQIPLDRLLFETDAPYLAPVPYRGKPSQPAQVVEVARFWADLHDLSLDEVAKATTANAKKVFGL